MNIAARTHNQVQPTVVAKFPLTLPVPILAVRLVFFVTTTIIMVLGVAGS